MEQAEDEVRKAYDALSRSRLELLAEREAIDTRLARIETALAPLRELLDEVTTGPVEIQTPSVDDELQTPSVDGDVAETQPVPAPSGAAKPGSRKARLREAMLEAPGDWFTAAVLAGLVEGHEPSTAQRTATYEMLRRMTVQGELERDNSSKPTRFRAKRAVVRERLLNDRG